MIDRCGLSVYHLLFLPYIMYCAEVWGNNYVTNIECLVLLQKKVVRLLCGAKRLDHTSRLFYNLCIVKVPDIVELKLVLLCLSHIILYCQRMYNCFSVSTNLFMQPNKIKQLLKSLHILI